MTTFIALQSTYHDIEIGLFKAEIMIECERICKLDASSSLIPSLHYLLTRHNLSLQHLAFIATNQGPGPFTTLRVVISTINALHFATGIPLVGVDGLRALLAEHVDAQYPYTIALLNAFNQDVYVGIYSRDTDTITTSCKNIDSFLQECSMMKTDKLRFLGNGASLHAQKIQEKLGSRALVENPLLEACSLQTLGKVGLEQWQTQQNIATHLSPLYLK